MRALLHAIANLTRSRFLRSVGWLWSGNGTELVLGLVQAIVVARVLGPKGFGTATLIMAYPSVVLGLVRTRTQDPAIRWLGTFVGRNDFNRTLAFSKLCFLVDLGISAAAFAIVVITAPWAAPTIIGSRADLSLLLLFSVGLVVQAPQTTSRAILSTLDRFDLHARYTVLMAALRASLVITFVAVGFGVAGVVWANTLAVAASGIVYLAVGQHHARQAWGGSIWTRPLSLLRGYGRRIARFFVATEVDSLFETVSKQGDVLILGYLLGPTSVGYYRLATRIAGAVGAMASPLDTVAFPRLARARAEGDDGAGYKRLVRRYLAVIALPGACTIAVAGVLAAPFMVRLIGGTAFAPAAGPAQILMGQVAVRIAFFWLVSVILAEGLLRLLVTRRIAITVLLVSGWLIAVPRLGVSGMAWVSLGVTLVVNSLVAVHVLRHVFHSRTSLLSRTPVLRRATRAQ